MNHSSNTHVLVFWLKNQAWDEDSPLVLEDEDFKNCEAEDEDEDSVL